MTAVKIGISLPSTVPVGGDPEAGRHLLSYMRKCEELGFDIWCIDHLLAARGLYSQAYLEPMTTLAMAAAVTSSVRIGSGVIVAPLRHPVTLAKAVSTLDHLSGGRFTLGMAPGWDLKEFDALGVPLAERGRRTDEVIELVRLLLGGAAVDFVGEFFEVKDVLIEPTPPSPVPIWVGGGGKAQDGLHRDKPVMVRTVLERILRADGWISRGAGSQQTVLHDLRTVQAGLDRVGREPDSLTIAHENFVHVVPGVSSAQALALQKDPAVAAFGEARSFDQLCTSYLFGSVDDQLSRLTELAEAGTSYFILAPLTPELEQLELISEFIAKPLGVVA